MSAVYAKEVFENTKFRTEIGNTIILYSDEFEVTINDFTVKFSWVLRKDYWAFLLQDTWIRGSNQYEEEHSYLFRNQEMDSHLFPEFVYVKKIDVEILTVFINHITEYLDDLMFDKRTGRFYTKAMIRANIARRCCFSKYLPAPEKCYVCLDEVSTKTPCGHTLCFPCWNNLAISKIICPACRQDISYVLNEDE